MTNKDVTKIRANKFDECVLELSPDAQKYFKNTVKYISDQLANGAGTLSAKELIFQFMRYMNDKQAEAISQPEILRDGAVVSSERS